MLRVSSPANGPVSSNVGPEVPRMLATIGRLAAGDLGGRRVGTAGGNLAAHWLASELAELGAQAVAFDNFAVIGATRHVYATPELVLDDGQPRSLRFRRDFCEHLASSDLPEPRGGHLTSFGEADMAGAWVLDASWSADRAAQARAAGACGLLVSRGTDEAGWMPKMIAGPAAGPLPALAVRTDIHQRMQTGIGQATVTASVPVRTVDVTGANVLATFRRAEPGWASVLLTAHFDGVGDDPDERFPAACDNGSGVAAIIEAARVLHEVLAQGVGLSVALLDAEEVGARGSAHHAPTVPAGTFVINLDGAAQLTDAAHVEAGGPAHALVAALDLAARQVGVPLRAHAMPSDNRRYAAAGLPSVGIGMGMPGYQTPTETPERVSPDTLERAARLVVVTAVHLTVARTGGQATTSSSIAD